VDSRDAVALVGHLAWPLTALLLLVLLRREVRSIAEALRGRIADRNSDLAITKAGIETRTNIEAVKARLATVEVGQDQQNHLLLQQVTAAGETTGVTDELREMAAAYLHIDIPDWAQRTRAKDDAANGMGLYVVTHHISRDALADEGDEGLILALASAVLLDPQREDTRRLLGASVGVNRLHVRYRILLAFNRLLERRLITGEESGRLRGVLAQFRVGADDSLRQRIDATAALLDTGIG
jgi:hypothetical protein